ncbi:hypothetical protein DFH08DRAFT_987471 [Mycena albidolilacea]|uniref:DUF6534 domain-containing protein n=1 Tax=Mycena albidolilacea TaxID=1033008 RepID=A0AAD7AAT1_9AGAR|nr:hypothetical protein DFH08DRAFT_987471 [Mycena albidolilacea]
MSSSTYTPGSFSSSWSTMTQYIWNTAPLLVGSQANWALFGVLAAQVYKFHSSPYKNSGWIKLLVYGLFSIEFFQSIMASHYAYVILVSGWGDPNIVTGIPWSAGIPTFCIPIVSVSVQIYFARRIYILSGKEGWVRFVSSVIVVLALMQSLAGLSSVVRFSITTSHAEIAILTLAVKFWVIGAAICDILVAATMLILLSRYRKLASRKSTVTFIVKLMVASIQTGIVPTFVALVMLVTYIVCGTQNNLMVMPSLILGKLYCNFLLYNLNIHVEDEPPSNISLTHITGIPASTSLHDKHQLQAGAHIKEAVEDSGESSR